MVDPSVRWTMGQLSDAHLVEPGRLAMGEVDTPTCLADAVHALSALRPSLDLVVCHGDLTDHGTSAEYELAGTLLGSIGAPVLLLPGNHDDLDGIRALMDGPLPAPATFAPAGGERFDGVVEGPVRVIALDTARPPADGGTLGPDQLDWLDSTLGMGGESPVVIVMHHPPFRTGLAEMDSIGLDPAAAEELAKVVARHPTVERVCAGHVHRATNRRWAGTVAATVPGVAHSISYDVQGGALAWSLEPPAVGVVTWGPDLGLVAHQVAVGTYPAHPY
jgi:3',5'-cyclic-AMP phosphodiesterase